MTTLSVPLSTELEKFVEHTSKTTGLAKTDIVRQALTHYRQELAVQKVLLGSTEPSLSGDLDDLLDKID